MLSWLMNMINSVNRPSSLGCACHKSFHWMTTCVLGMTLNCIHIFIVALYWCVMRQASHQRFFIHSCIYLRILVISYLAMFHDTNSPFALMCRKAVNQSIEWQHWVHISSGPSGYITHDLYATLHSIQTVLHTHTHTHTHTPHTPHYINNLIENNEKNSIRQYDGLVTLHTWRIMIIMMINLPVARARLVQV